MIDESHVVSSVDSNECLQLFRQNSNRSNDDTLNKFRNFRL